MKDFKNLEVWKKAHLLTLEIYRESKGFPKEEMFGLTSQLRRAAASIPTNIAEGCGRQTDSDFARFIQIAFGSANEVDYLLILLNDLQILNADRYSDINKKLSEIKKMLVGLLKKLRK